MSKDECCYLCNECPASFTSLDSLEDHLKSGQHILARTESSPKVLVNTVDVTDMDTSIQECTTMESASSLNFDDEFSCNLCPRKFSDREMLNTHQVHTHRQKPSYVCEICQLEFAIKRDKQTHMRIHSGEKPQRCEACGKEFGTRQLLKKHQLWHTGERAYSCHICNKSFFQRGHLSQHYQIHKGVRPFACTLCEKTFIFKFDLNRHMKIHAVRSFCCKSCAKSFSCKTSLDAHLCKPKKLSAKFENLSMSDLSQADTTTLNSPSTISQQSPNPLSPNDVKKEADGSNQPNYFARMAQDLFAQHQQRVLNVVHNPYSILQQQVSNPLPAPNPIQLALLLQQYRQQVQAASFRCGICPAAFDNQAAYTVHCLRAHFNGSGPNLMQPKEENYENTSTSSCASSPQKHSPVLTQQLINPDWLSSAAQLPASPSSCEKCNELEKSNTQMLTELDRLRALVGQMSAMTNLLGLQRATN